MPNYPRAAATAKRLVDGAGRSVTLVRLSGSTPDGAKEWRGVADPRATPEATLQVKAAFLPLTGEMRLGLSKTTQDLIKKSDATCLIGTTLDLSQYTELIDTVLGRFKITAAEVLKPGDLSLLWFLVLNQ